MALRYELRAATKYARSLPLDRIASLRLDTPETGEKQKKVLAIYQITDQANQRGVISVVSFGAWRRRRAACIGCSSTDACLRNQPFR